MSESVPPLPQITIESLDQEARGIGHVAGKVVFVEGALAGERVHYHPREVKRSYEIAVAGSILRESPARVVPRCRYFGVCGGCSMQHLDERTQVAVKQRILEDNLARIGKVRVDLVFRPIHGPGWRYRARARLAVQVSGSNSAVRIGFFERRSRRVADIDTCEIVTERTAALLVPLRLLIAGLGARDRITAIEVIAHGSSLVLVIHGAGRLARRDEDRLLDFARTRDVSFWLRMQGGVLVSVGGITGEGIAYDLPQWGVRIGYLPGDFTQVNPAINRILVGRCVALLDPQQGERLLDLFCGLGNFTLALARRAGFVVGVDGQSDLVGRARSNAVQNQLSERVRFEARNLFAVDAGTLSALGRFDKMLIDPPREGAFAICQAIADQGAHAPRRIVYVSCDPATLARDAGILVHRAGYRLAGAGVVNMFPQTSHVESITVFERDP